MTPRVARDVKQLLGPLDPAPLVSVQTDAEWAADRDRIMRTSRADTAGTHRGRPRSRRMMLVGAGGVACAAVLAVAAVNVFDASTSPAYAATPAPLSYPAAGSQRPAAEVIEDIVAATRRLPRAAPAGDVEHLVRLEWALWSQVDGERVTSAVIPARHESWRAADDSGRSATSYEPPTFAKAADEERWEQDGSPGGPAAPQRQEFGIGQFPVMWRSDPPVEPAAFRRWLAEGHPAVNGPEETIVAVTDLARERLLDPATRVNVLRVLADLPGLVADGRVTDRAGRSGESFSLFSRRGLPARYTLVVEPATGKLLGYEKTLTETAGKLDVRIPAVITYETYLTSDLVAKPG